jgi:uncharacterized membrane protein
MNSIDAWESPGFTLVARRNNSLSASGRRLVVGSLVAVSLTISLGFVALGAWPVLPFWGLEMLGLYVAFHIAGRHADDYERISIRGDQVLIEKSEARRQTAYEFNRRWARLVVQPAAAGRHARVALRSHGREVEFGQHLTDDQRLEAARALRHELTNG